MVRAFPCIGGYWLSRCSGWPFDAMDQRLFILRGTPALRDLLPASAADQLPTFAGWATGLFIAGWATGGLLFSLLGDPALAGSGR